jgi:hypothetical protein
MGEAAVVRDKRFAGERARTEDYYWDLRQNFSGVAIIVPSIEPR